MQTAEVVLNVLRERGKKGLPCTQLYRQLFNKDLYLVAYGNIYSNQGAMTPGASEETADGMSEEKIEHIIGAMRHERYRFSPARRTYIPKRNGKLRPLGMPTWSDKLISWRGSPTTAGSDLRTTVLGQLARVPEVPGMSYRAAGDKQHLDRDRLVYRRRHLRLLGPMFTLLLC
jgi:hypothetical protein